MCVCLYIAGRSSPLVDIMHGNLSFVSPQVAALLGVVEFALGATPLSLFLVVIGYLFIMNTGYQFSKHVNSAGSYYTFAGKGLGGIVGTFQAWNMAFYGGNLCLIYQHPLGIPY